MISYAINVLIIILLLILFGFIHSFLASNGIKRFIKNKLGNKIAFYRLVYNIFSLLLFYFIFMNLPKAGPLVYDLPYPFDLIILVPQFLSLAGLFWAAKYFSLQEFLGIDQIKRWINKEYNINDLDEHLTLRIEGPYKYVRHPIYFFSITFLLFRPVMDLYYLTLLIVIILYFFIGSVYEEKKLVEKFGEAYTDYQKKVPRIIPVNLFHANKY